MYALYEMPCTLCRVLCHVDLLEDVELFPHGLVCPPCAAELRADDDDACSGEDEPYEGPACVCRSFCAECLGGDGR
jgi:hypothetical protein